MNSYLAEPIPEFKENPLKWWYERRAKFPRIIKLVKKHSSMIANSAPCERIFSKMGNIVTTLRNSLSVGTATRLGMIAQNLPRLPTSNHNEEDSNEED